MSWNGSEQANSPARIQPALKPKAANPVRNRQVWWLCGGFVLLGCLAICVFISGSEPEKRSVDKKPNPKPKIRTAAPVTNASPKSATPISNVQKNASTALTNSTQKDLGFYTNKLGIVKRRTGKSVVIDPRPEKQLFNCQGDRFISSIVNTEPGEMIVDPDLPANLKEILAEALVTQVEFADDDTPLERLKKQRVIDAKSEIQSMLKNGNDIVQVFQEAKQKMIRQSQLYREVRGEYEELKLGGASKGELAEFVYAAEKAMKSQGIETNIHVPLKLRKRVKDISDRMNSLQKDTTNE